MQGGDGMMLGECTYQGILVEQVAFESGVPNGRSAGSRWRDCRTPRGRTRKRQEPCRCDFPRILRLPQRELSEELVERLKQHLPAGWLVGGSLQVASHEVGQAGE